MNISLMLMSIPHSYYNLICNVVIITEWDVWLGYEDGGLTRDNSGLIKEAMHTNFAPSVT